MPSFQTTCPLLQQVPFGMAVPTCCLAQGRCVGTIWALPLCPVHNTAHSTVLASSLLLERKQHTAKMQSTPAKRLILFITLSSINNSKYRYFRYLRPRLTTWKEFIYLREYRQHNRKGHIKGCVVYCGPSNKAADVVHG